MKYKLVTLVAASFAMAATGQETKKANSANMPKDDPKAEASTKVASSIVAKSIAPVLKKFKGEKYVPTKLAGNPDYYIMYFTASW